MNPTDEQPEYMKTLAGLTAKAIHCSRLIIESGGELSPELEDELTVNQENLATKIDGYSFMLDQFEMDETRWRMRAASCEEIARRYRSEADKLKSRIANAMNEMKTNEIRGHQFIAKMSVLTPKLKVDKALVPKDFWRMKQELDEKRIKETLAEGWEVPGCTLVASYSVRFKSNLAN